MRTTVRIDDELMRELKQRAAEHKMSLTQFLNRALRLGLSVKKTPQKPYRERTHSMGVAQVNLDKALALASSEDDAEAARKLELRR
jgi:plasmid stability protein